MSAPSRKPSLRQNTRRAVADLLAANPLLETDSALLGWLAGAVEHRTPAELKAVVLGVLDARADARMDAR